MPRPKTDRRPRLLAYRLALGPTRFTPTTDELRKSLSASVFEICCLLYKSLAKACACANGKMLLENNDDNDDNDNNDITATGQG